MACTSAAGTWRSPALRLNIPLDQCCDLNSPLSQHRTAISAGDSFNLATACPLNLVIPAALVSLCLSPFSSCKTPLRQSSCLRARSSLLRDERGQTDRETNKNGHSIIGPSAASPNASWLVAHSQYYDRRPNDKVNPTTYMTTIELCRPVHTHLACEG